MTSVPEFLWPEGQPGYGYEGDDERCLPCMPKKAEYDVAILTI